MSEGQIALILVTGLVVVLVAVTIRFPYRARTGETQAQGIGALMTLYQDEMTKLQTTVKQQGEEIARLETQVRERDTQIAGLITDNARLRAQVDWLTETLRTSGQITTSPPQHDSRAKKIILFITASPREGEKLDTDIEARTIEESLRGGKLGGEYVFRQVVAARILDVTREMANLDGVEIVHFSGHGMEDGELVLEQDARAAQPITIESIGSLLSGCPVRGVVLNACWSATNHGLLVSGKTKVADWVVGMRKPVNDDSAILFAGAFYQALAAGREIDRAFIAGKSAAGMNALGQMGIPVLAKAKP